MWIKTSKSSIQSRRILCWPFFPWSSYFPSLRLCWHLQALGVVIQAQLTIPSEGIRYFSYVANDSGYDINLANNPLWNFDDNYIATVELSQTATSLQRMLFLVQAVNHTSTLILTSTQYNGHLYIMTAATRTHPNGQNKLSTKAS